ncbi:alpha/beta fold hydrolase [Hymenobacter defluvii]|uniref:Alpha/beta hydrolase n=1 Tax=Hymenobacter defluvii TaxID=2054411 RepID=A0ABS3TA01_9BACT|nr:alpha/beta hydrolase [Hymenobacter defluvii]MBO3270487.1 alpha/beta hydrolase [Hymenobacter defluvii]
MTYLLEHYTVPTNGQQLHVVQCGPADGPLVVLLHGFPDFWYGWQQQLQALAEAGYRVWAPDQRGYNRSSKPPRIRDYRIEELAADVLGLLAAAGKEKATIVGHDWGAAVAWWLATHRPTFVERVAVLNVPHPAVLARALRHNGRQRRRSWYVFFFQLPRLPEWWLRRRHYKALRRALQGTSRPGTFGHDDMAAYQAAWAQLHALRGMVNWYRAVRYQRRGAASATPITVPVRIIWGSKDAFLLPELAQQSLAYCEQGELFYLPEASHWVQHEEPARVNQLLLEFLEQPSRT